MSQDARLGSLAESPEVEPDSCLCEGETCEADQSAGSDRFHVSHEDLGYSVDGSSLSGRGLSFCFRSLLGSIETK